MQPPSLLFLLLSLRPLWVGLSEEGDTVGEVCAHVGDEERIGLDMDAKPRASRAKGVGNSDLEGVRSEREEGRGGSGKGGGGS